MAEAPQVLCLLAEGFEEIEALAPVDILRRAGAEVVVASITLALQVTGRSKITVQADATLDELPAERFDALILPGGPGVQALRKDGQAAFLASTFVSENKLVGAICAAPTILLDARVLDGRRFTAHYSVHNELPAALADERVVVDGPIITSRGAGTAVEFGLALVEYLFGAEKAQQIASSIMA